MIRVASAFSQFTVLLPIFRKLLEAENPTLPITCSSSVLLQPFSKANAVWRVFCTAFSVDAA